MRTLQILALMSLLATIFLAGCSGDDDDNNNNDSGDDDVTDDDGAADDDAADDDAADDDVADDDVTDDDAVDDDTTDDDVVDDDTTDDDTTDDDTADDDSGQGDLVQNGGFETGDTTNWDGEWPWSDLVWMADPGDDDTTPDTTFYIVPHSGQYAAWFGQQAMGDAQAWLGQSFIIPEGLLQGTIDMWYYLYKFSSCTFEFAARLVDANNPDNTLLELGAWTEADADFIAHYAETNHPLTAGEISDLAGQEAMLRFEYSGHSNFLTACYIYLDDVSFQAQW